MYQRKPSWCAPAAIQMAMHAYGRKMGQARIARTIGTTEDGTDSPGILQGLQRLGFVPRVIDTRRKADARSWLVGLDGPALLCVDSWDHWVCVAGGCRDRLWLMDPSPDVWNHTRLGRWLLKPDTILKRWRASRKLQQSGGAYYGIALE